MGIHLERWFIQNRHESLYMQVDDDDEPNYINDGGIAEIRSFNGADYQKWIFTNAGDGDHKITSKISGYAVTVPSGEESEENIDLVLKPYTGSNNQKWKITLTSYGSCKIKAKSSESITDRDLVMVSSNQHPLFGRTEHPAENSTVTIQAIRMSGFVFECCRQMVMSWHMIHLRGPVYHRKTTTVVHTHSTIKFEKPVGNSIWFKQQPGEYYNNHRGSCAPIPQGYQSPPSVIVNSVQQDFNKYNSVNGTSLLFTPIGRYETCPVGTYKVALVVSNSDYHWYRQDADGLWSHKRGTTPVKRTDESGELIIDPMIADRDDYSTFVGFFAVKPWNNIYNSSKGVTLVSEDVISTTIE